jgi:hypothetical protein
MARFSIGSETIRFYAYRGKTPKGGYPASIHLSVPVGQLGAFLQDESTAAIRAARLAGAIECQIDQRMTKRATATVAAHSFRFHLNCFCRLHYLFPCLKSCLPPPERRSGMSCRLSG